LEWRSPLDCTLVGCNVTQGTNQIGRHMSVVRWAASGWSVIPVSVPLRSVPFLDATHPPLWPSAILLAITSTPAAATSLRRRLLVVGCQTTRTRRTLYPSSIRPSQQDSLLYT
jgi:hypothetical protein